MPDNFSPEIEKALDGVRQKVKNKLKKDDGRISVSMHVPESEITRPEGEKWTDDDGKQWEMKDGKKHHLDPLAGIRTPWWCPECGHPLTHKAYEKMYKKTGKCLDCVTKEETQIRHAGKWDLYERIKVRANMIAYLRDVIEELEGYKATVNQPSFVLASGELQQWNVNLDKVKADLQRDIDGARVNREQLLKDQAIDESKYTAGGNND